MADDPLFEREDLANAWHAYHQRDQRLQPRFQRGLIRLSDVALCKLDHDQRMAIIISHISNHATDNQPVITRHEMAGLAWVVVTDVARSTTKLMHVKEYE